MLLEKFGYDIFIKVAYIRLKILHIKFTGIFIRQKELGLHAVFYCRTHLKVIPSDRLPIGGNIRMPIFYTLLASTGIVMSESGAMQHPEVYLLEADEYDDFICDPFACMIDKLLPRLYKSLDTASGRASIIMAEAYKARADSLAEMSRISANNTKKYGYAQIDNGGFTDAPFDFLADFMRSFTGISSDIRRKPQCVSDACEALLPHMINVGLNKDSSSVSRTEIPLHMAPFLNTRLFEKFYWPSFEKLIKGLSEGGAGIFLQAENDWMRYLEHLNSLDGDIEIEFEYGDPALTANKIAGKHVIEGFYPAVMIQTSNKNKCIDKAKELLDILMPEKTIFSALIKVFLP